MGFSPRLAVYNAKGNPDLAVTTLDNGSSIGLFDLGNADRIPTVRLTVDNDRPNLLCVKEGKLLWSAL
jgi:hypothetical protein